MKHSLMRIRRRAFRLVTAASRATFLGSSSLQFRLFGRAKFTDTQGLQYYLYPDDDLSLVFARKTLFDDQAIFPLLRQVISSDAIVVDVGANIGLVTLYAAKNAADGHIFAFEPEQVNLERLRRNIQLARCNNVTIVSSGVADFNGIATLNVFSNNRVLNSLGRPIIQTSTTTYIADTTQEVSMTTLDDFAYAHGISNIDLLKVDVEGAEPRVFAGCQRLLSERKIHYIIFEISQTPLHALGYTAHNTFDALEQHGYVIERILPGGITQTYDRQEDANVILANFLAIRP